ncbi:hypothetical protein AMJ39_06310 [candidate division TA06 bacterium DG_24]|uniref:Gingipain propeptide domain-containing protein n=1 Tax=candidate division TA06 bacterium DG_24 TaxID=1703770 RepID=A0A0S7WS81_UNCT6|nr:MAG: hypothetical protein AMJ39_06310 [candidate division TA06 bacterium DG_24]
MQSGKKWLSVSVLLLLCVGICASAGAGQSRNWIPLNRGLVKEGVNVELLEGGREETLIEVTVGGVWIEDLDVSGEHYQLLTVPGAGRLTEEGRPAVPALAELVGGRDRAR